VVKVTGMGKLVPSQDERALAQGLIEVLRNPAAYCKPRELIQDIFNTQRTVEQYEQLLQSLTA
jgi:glycosyltransferase involved in cell wall biosynthesis